MSEHNARKRKHRHVVAEEHGQTNFSEHTEWISPTQTSLGLTGQPPNARTSVVDPRTRRKHTPPSTANHAVDLEPNGMAIDWELKRLQGKTSKEKETEQGTGFVIWDEEDAIDALPMSRDEEIAHGHSANEATTTREESSASPRASNESLTKLKRSSDADSDEVSEDDIEDKTQKHRRMLDDARHARLRALGPEEPENASQDAWGRSDEEPPDAVENLIVRTAAHLQSATDATQLVARILANHGGDTRFAFLRGRWRRAWERAREKAKGDAEKIKDDIESKGNGLLFGLGAYDDSDEDNDDEADNVAVEGEEETSRSAASRAETTHEAAKMARRRKKAREWAATRRAEQAKGVS